MKNASGPMDDALPLGIVNLIHERHGHSSPAQLAAGAERFLARIQQRRQPRRPLIWAIAAAAASVTILALVVTILHRTPQALEVSIRGAHLLTGGAIESDPVGNPVCTSLTEATFAFPRRRTQCCGTSTLWVQPSRCAMAMPRSTLPTARAHSGCSRRGLHHPCHGDSVPIRLERRD